MSIKFGFYGFRHSHIFSLYQRVKDHAETEIAAAYEANDNARKAAEAQGVVFNCDTPEEFFNTPQLDVVAIGGAYGDRADVVIKALKAGKHVISDKPFCITPEKLDEIEKIITEKKAVLGCMFDLRTAPNFHTAQQLIRSGKIGEVSAIQFNGMHPLNYGVRPAWYFEKNMHGGTINDIAIHLFDLLPGLTGNGVKNILSAQGGNFNFPQEPHFSNRGVLLLELENGAYVSGDVSYFAQAFADSAYWRFSIWGTAGSMEFNYNDPGVKLTVGGESQIIQPVAAPSDYFDAFLSELAGTPATPCTQEILKTARLALNAQQKANKI